MEEMRELDVKIWTHEMRDLQKDLDEVMERTQRERNMALEQMCRSWNRAPESLKLPEIGPGQQYQCPTATLLPTATPSATLLLTATPVPQIRNSVPPYLQSFYAMLEGSSMREHYQTILLTAMVLLTLLIIFVGHIFTRNRPQRREEIGKYVIISIIVIISSVFFLSLL